MKDAIKEIFPPDVPPLVRWRLAIFLSVMFFFLFIVWACGGFEWLGFGGFAKAGDLRDKVEQVTNDVGSVKYQVAQVQIDLIEQRMFDYRLKQCTTDSIESKQFYARQVESLFRELVRLNPGARLPACDEVR